MRRRIYLSVDGGGSKLRMLLFDGDYNILGEGLCGGVNLNSTSEADARANVARCLSQAFSRAGAPPETIDALYYVFVGDGAFLPDALRPMCHVAESVHFSEPLAGLLAGALWRSGILALSPR
jgi:N-acetylglucosamine kinase-like BadF-type ATPase